jgi:hypothetical protein
MARINKLETHYKEHLKDHNINDVSNFIQNILDADMTKGKYARFLIESFLKDKFLEEDLIGGLDSTIGQAISLFHKHKSKLPIEYRSVYAVNQETGKALYQSPGDLWNSVKQYQGELSGKELKRDEQERVYRETEFIYKDEETGFQIISPLTKESAQWWGKGTRWCTSAEKNIFFEYYAGKAPLLILLIPASASTAGNGNKLQLWQFDNEIQFMDEADNKVTLDYIKENWKILEPICRWLNNIKYIPDKYKTYDIWKLAVQQNGNILEYIPKHLITKELCESAVKQNGRVLEYVPEYLRTQKLYELAVQSNGIALEYIPKHLKTQKLYELAVQQNGMALEYVPKYLRTLELCKIAVQQNGLALQWIPDKFRTKELYELAVQQNGMSIKYVPEEFLTKELCEMAIQQNGYALKFIPLLITKKTCELAVKQNGYALRCIPKDIRTKEICELAVQQNGRALQDVPEKLKTKELCEFAVKQDEKALRYVPENLRNELKKYVKEILFELPMDKYQKTFQDIKTFFPTKDVSLSYHHS